ncbi:MAG: aldo/keto reductase family protein [bacterium]
MIEKKITLRNGVEIPRMIISSNHMNYKQLLDVVIEGVNSGFNGFDTSPSYKSETDLGKVINKIIIDRGMKRQDFFVIDKVDKIPMLESNGNITSYVESSLEKLKMQYIDLLLIHWPLPNYYISTWKCMEKLHEKGLVKAIGVCNFRKRHLLSLLNADINVCPMVNQIELHPLRTAKGLVNFHKKYDIVTQSYTPLCRMVESVTKAKVIEESARKYNKTKAQIILRWQIQNGYIPVFKTQRSKRVRENIDIFDFSLNDNEMSSISALNVDFKYFPESSCCPGF